MQQANNTYSIVMMVFLASTIQEVLEPIQEVIDEQAEALKQLVARFYAEPITPALVLEFEQALGEIGRETSRRILEIVLNRCDPESAEDAPHDVTFEAGGYRRLNQKTRNAHVDSTFGRITLWRRGYRYWHRGEKEPTIFPLELILGLWEGATPLLASQIGRMMAETGATQQRVLEQLKERFGVSLSVARLRAITEALSTAMEEYREEYQVAKLLELLEKAYRSPGRYKPVFSVGRDGINMPVERGGGYLQGAVATVSVSDRRGRRLGTVYLAHAPEPYQTTLTEQLTALIQACLQAWCCERGRPMPRLCYVTDAGETECGYYAKVLTRLADPRGNGQRLHWYRIIDFYHASQRLTVLGEALFGPGAEASSWARRMRKILKEEPNGVSRVLHSAAAFRSRYGVQPGREAEFALAYNYLRSRSRHMNYAEFRRLRMPIGSGVTEAACKTVFTERLKLSGMGWSLEGAQVILTLRVILLSGVWDGVYAAVLKGRNPVNLRTYANVTSDQPPIAA